VLTDNVIQFSFAFRCESNKKYYYMPKRTIEMQQMSSVQL